MRSTDRPLLDHLEREEREVQRRLSVLRRRRLADKSQALAEAWEQVREGTYGLCRACGGRIPRRRLEALPTATLCVPCQEQHEAG